jgi:hypothetical protein
VIAARFQIGVGLGGLRQRVAPPDWDVQPAVGQFSGQFRQRPGRRSAGSAPVKRTPRSAAWSSAIVNRSYDSCPVNHTIWMIVIVT